MANEDNDNESPNIKPFKFFGRDLRKIPCFRDSCLTGIYGGLAGGLLYYLFTSKARMSCHVAFGFGWFCTFAYWIPCRYKFESKLLMMEKKLQ